MALETDSIKLHETDSPLVKKQQQTFKLQINYFLKVTAFSPLNSDTV